MTWICEQCGHPGCEGTHVKPPTFGPGPHMDAPPTEGAFDLIADPERYWKWLAEEIKKWPKAKESDMPDPPEFL